MKKYKIIFMGTSFFAKEILFTLNKIDVEIVAVISQPDNIQKRNNKIIPTPVKIISNELGLKILQPLKISSIKTEIEKLKPDFILTCAYGQFIPDDILKIPKLSLNIHASLLPKLRGGAPIHWAIINGDIESGISIIKMTKKMDAGPIYLQKKINISIKDTREELEMKLITLSKEIIKNDLINIFDGNFNIIEQNEKKATFAFTISRDDEKIDFNDSIINIYNKIRGLYKIPGAYGLLNSDICKIYESKYLFIKTNNNIKNGTIIKIDKEGIHLKLKDGFLILKKIQLSGKKIQSTEWFYKNAPKKIYVGGIYE